ncbi:MAG: TRAP transporter permease, partial [Alphaproteobacteria bacterium]|nr:TRAP transporter permease [Alphaproteobacteria bacterium]
MLDPIAIGVVGLVVLFALLMLRMPVGIAMILVGVGGTYALSLSVPYVRFVPYIRQFKSLLWENVANYDLSVVPLFVLMGYIAAEARLSSDLFKGLEALLSRLRGGVAMAAIAACGGFGAVCGSSLATAATMGKVALPELKKLGYADRLSAGALAAGGTLGILIPP